MNSGTSKVNDLQRFYKYGLTIQKKKKGGGEPEIFSIWFLPKEGRNSSLSPNATTSTHIPTTYFYISRENNYAF